MHFSVLLTYSVSFSVVGFMWRTLIHLNLSFVHRDKYGSIFIHLHVDAQLCQHQFLNMLSYFHFSVS